MNNKYEVVIDRGSQYYEIEAKTPEEAQEKAKEEFRKQFPKADYEYEWWVGVCEEVE